VRQICADNLDNITQGLAGVVRMAQSRGDWNATLDPEAVARVMIAIHDGFAQQKAFDPRIDTKAYIDAALALFTGALWTRPASAGTTGAGRRDDRHEQPRRAPARRGPSAVSR
jgi:hypothetical protein